MKVCSDLYPKICDFTNLCLAYQKARRGKRIRPDVFEFDLQREENLLQIQDELLAKTWLPGPYREFYIQESKKRIITAAPFRDRVVHHALCNVIEPIYEKMFIYDSYACRKGKGTHAAADRYTEFSRKARYVLKCDVSRYFPSIRHDDLLSMLKKHSADEDTMGLCDKIVRSYGEGNPRPPSP